MLSNVWTRHCPDLIATIKPLLDAEAERTRDTPVLAAMHRINTAAKHAVSRARVEHLFSVAFEVGEHIGLAANAGRRGKRHPLCRP